MTNARFLALQAHLACWGTSAPNVSAGQALDALVEARLDHLPLPGQGQTLLRWQMLAAVAAHDLSLLKLFEAHEDAMAIMAELDFDPGASRTWGVWCAEPPDARLRCSESVGGHGVVTLDGKKAWCSGAATLSHALVSAWNPQGETCLVSVKLNQPGVTVTNSGWQAVGMAGSASVDVLFEQAAGQLVGSPGAYLSRPGFWHGGAGIAAAWYGAAAALGQAVHAACLAKAQAKRSEPHQLAHLGHIDVALTGARALMQDVAHWIDHHPMQDACTQALRIRLAVEACATQVLHHAGRALGPGPLCKDARLAHLMADLPIFLRQSHAERDLAALGQTLLTIEEPSWTL